MGKVTGFLEIDRRTGSTRRVRQDPALQGVRAPGVRGDDQGPGVALHELRHPVYVTTAAAVNNQIPGLRNDLVYQEDWDSAAQPPFQHNNFPEFTGRVCPAPARRPARSNIEDTPDTISRSKRHHRQGWEMGWVVPEPPKAKTGKSIGIVGSGRRRHGGRPAARPPPAMTCISTRRTPRRRPPPLRHPRTSRWRSANVDRASSRWRRRA